MSILDRFCEGCKGKNGVNTDEILNTHAFGATSRRMVGWHRSFKMRVSCKRNAYFYKSTGIGSFLQKHQKWSQKCIQNHSKNCSKIIIKSVLIFECVLGAKRSPKWLQKRPQEPQAVFGTVIRHVLDPPGPQQTFKKCCTVVKIQGFSYFFEASQEEADKKPPKHPTSTPKRPPGGLRRT